MAAKPSTLPRWANSGGDVVVPLSGKQDVGWVEGEDPPAPYFNWLFLLIYQWLLYLSDGALSGNHSITGDLSVTGDVTIGDDLVVNGDLDLSGADTIKFPPRSMFIAANNAYLYSGSGTFNAPFWNGGAVGQIHLPIFVPIGWRITTIKVRYRRNSGTLNFDLHSLDYGSVSASIANGNIASGTSDAELTISSINHTVVADREYVLRASMGDALDRFYGATVTWDKVA
jgi:hypothetical protein